MRSLGQVALALTALCGLPCAVRQTSAHEAITTRLTWTRNVSRIVLNRCAGCHRRGGPAPMPLTTYEEVRPWAAAIKHEVLARRMPPWGAVKGFGAFRNDPSLSLPEIAVLSSWAEGGAPEGDPVYLDPHHDHDHAHPEPDPGPVRFAVSGRVRLEQPLVVAGVTPATGLKAPWLQVTAHLPDGGVEHLLWLRGGAPAAARDYWFLRPVELPEGTRLLCEPETASVDLRLAADGKRIGP